MTLSIRFRPSFAAFSSFLLALLTVCGGGKSSGKNPSLYLFDGSTKSLMVWDDLEGFYNAETLPAASRTLNSEFFAKIGELAWGGMAFDPQNNQLYLVAETGELIRVDRLRRQTGSISQMDTVSMTLSLQGAQKLNGSKFRQTAIDAATRTLYIAETGEGGTRIWSLANAGTLTGSQAVCSLMDLPASDRDCHGLTAHNGEVYAYLDKGDPIGPVGQSISGPRLRRGGMTGFSMDQNVLVGSNTSLSLFGSLAPDNLNNFVFVGRHLEASQKASSLGTGQPILAFKKNQFIGAYNQSPSHVLGSDTAHRDIRVLAHPGNSNWLVALRSSGDDGNTATSDLLIWKDPQTSEAKVKTVSISLPGGKPSFRGAALDANK